MLEAVLDRNPEATSKACDMEQRWLPLGTDRPITAEGVFPRSSDALAAIELSRAHGTMNAEMDLTKYNDEAETTDADFERIVVKGYAERLSSAAAVTTRFGEVRAPRVAVVAEVKDTRTAN